MKPRHVTIGASVLSLAGLIFAVLSSPTIPTVPAAPLPIQGDVVLTPPIQVPGVPTIIQVAPGAPKPGPVLDTLSPLPVIDPPPKPAPAPVPAAQEPAPAAQEPAPACQPDDQPCYQPCWPRWRRCR